MKIVQLFAIFSFIIYALNINGQTVSSNVNGVTTILTANDAGTSGLLVASTMGKDLSLGTRSDNGFWYERMWVKYNSGFIGIGTNNPSDLLHVNGRIRANELIMPSNLYFSQSGNYTDGKPYARLLESWGMRFASPDPKWVLSSGTSVLVGYQPMGENWGNGNLYVQNNVGIGLTNPSSALTVKGTGGGGTIRILPSADNGESGIGLFNSSTGVGTQWVISQGGWGNTGKLVFGYNNPKVVIQQDGNVGIGTTNPNKGVLHVVGSLHVENAEGKQTFHVSAGKQLVFVGDSAWIQYQATLNNPNSPIQSNNFSLWVSKGVVSENYAVAGVNEWDDYVFNEDYELPALEKIAAFVKTNKHLPNIPSEAEVKQNGYSMHLFNRGILKTTEELTLYIIEQDEEIKALKQKTQQQDTQLKVLQEKATQYEQLAAEIAALKVMLKEIKK